MAACRRRPGAGVALSIAMVALGLPGGCVAQRVTAVDSLAGGADGSTDAPADAAPPDDGAEVGPVPQRCTMPNAVCTCDNNGCNVGSYYLFDNQYNCGGNACGPESAFGCANANHTVSFVVTSNQPKGNTAVLAYSSMQDNFNDAPLTSFSSITSTFAEVSPRVGSYEVAFDVWLNGVGAPGSLQVMVWVDAYNRLPLGSHVTTTPLGGRAYDVYRTNSGSQITLVATKTFTSGSVDLLEIFDWTIAQGMAPSSSTLGQIELGVEIVSTDGTPATFYFDDFSVVTQ